MLVGKTGKSILSLAVLGFGVALACQSGSPHGQAAIDAYMMSGDPKFRVQKADEMTRKVAKDSHFSDFHTGIGQDYLIYRSYLETSDNRGFNWDTAIDWNGLRKSADIKLRRLWYLNKAHRTKIAETRDLREQLLKSTPNDYLLLMAASYDETCQGNPTIGLKYARELQKIEPNNFLVNHRIAIAYHYIYGRDQKEQDALEAIRFYKATLKAGPPVFERKLSIEGRITTLEKLVAARKANPHFEEGKRIRS